MVLNRLKSLFRQPEPAGPAETIRSYGVSDHPLTQDALTVEDSAWRIAFDEARSVRVFEIERPNVEQCILTYRAQLRTKDAGGAIYLEMWCRFAGKGEFFSKGLQQAVRGTTDWSAHETSFLLKTGQRPDLIKLNVVAEGPGTAWIKGVELTRTPLR
jgi:hypothetical protein